jgi:molecular chaperone GrpE
MTAGMSREQILRRFEVWLDGAMAAEEPPRGIDAEILEAVTVAANQSREPSAAYSVWSAMTALTQEVKLQGRSFKELNETIGSQPNRMAERERDWLVRETERRCRKEVLGALIDLRDRLDRGIDSVRANEAAASKAQSGWLARIFGDRRAGGETADTIAALKKGYELGLERVDQTLEEWNAREIRCAGQVFDPRRMNAVDRQESSAVPEGTVLEVYRSGYEWNGELFRPAQVKVACAPAGKEI